MPSLYESGPSISDEEWDSLIAGRKKSADPSPVGNATIDRAIRSITSDTSPRQQWHEELQRRQQAAESWRQPADSEE